MKWLVGVIAGVALVVAGVAWYTSSGNRVKQEPVRSDTTATGSDVFDRISGAAKLGSARSDATAAAAPTALETVHAGSIRVNPKDGLKYVWVPAGSFQMGCSPGDTQCDTDETPTHEVTISKGLWLGQTDVTQAAWRRVINTDPSDFKGDELPVESVDWSQAVKYCETIGGRLPTEAEWEYAARAGSTSARYGELDAIAWYRSNSGNTTHAVAGKQPNQFGLYDMLGNVWQWVEDDYGPSKGGSQKDPLVKLDGAKKVVRGGSWSSNPRNVRASNRFRFEPTDRYNNIGFRCVGN